MTTSSNYYQVFSHVKVINELGLQPNLRMQLRSINSCINQNTLTIQSSQHHPQVIGVITVMKIALL
jgi:hypothetical protein